MARCSTQHGTYQCDRDEGHVDERGIPTECETSKGPRAPVVVDLRRSLAAAQWRIIELEAALTEIRTAPCDSPSEGASCLCCLHDRMIATAVLEKAS